ncbi:hypothetical protein NQ317_005337 [Molorchus minor]|uniref:Vacuolar fusion protein MON1 homolog n=1 Tax=Molorchus minor TaxID=1323400 RepID=A0ABQ9JG97_9CUCU|nr:hypothetical protein NQ317_005337 [Molorchus minor]
MIPPQELLEENPNITNYIDEDSADNNLKDNEDWTRKKKHVFILSSAGKPIYSRYGNEDKLAWLFGVMQTLVSFVQSSGDCIKSIHAANTLFVFLVKKPLILVAVSKAQDGVQQLTSELSYVFNQITSILTLTRLNKIYEQRQNYDLRRLLAGVERLIDHLLDYSETEPSFFLGAVECLPLSLSVRDTINSAIVAACNKIKNLVFVILLAKNKLISLIRMKKYCLHPADLHLIFNLVQASESLKNSESWTPLCLPRFDSSVKPNSILLKKLRRGNCLEAINESLNVKDESYTTADFQEIRHYLYKCKSTAQFYQPSIGPPYTQTTEHLINVYKRAHHKLHSTVRPLKLIFERNSKEAILAWDTKGFELYIVFEPLIDTTKAISFVGKLLNWIKKKEERIFHLNAPTL